MSNEIQSVPIVGSKNRTRMAKPVVVVGSMDGKLPLSDRAAVGIAACRFGGDFVVCSPYGDETALRFAMGAGAKEVVSIDDCSAMTWLIGRGGSGTDGELMAAQLATAQSATLVLEVLDVEWNSGNLIVPRNLGFGAKEVLTISGPVVLVVSDEAPQSMYVSRFRQLAARLPPVQPSLPSPVNWEPARLRTKASDWLIKTSGSAPSRMLDAFGLRKNSETDGQHMISENAETCADHLVRYLAHHGFVERRLMPVVQDDLDNVPRAARPSESQVAANSPLPIRAPRPYGYFPQGFQRRPRPYRPLAPHLGKLHRRPRPIGSEQPTYLRGPFPLASNRNSTDGGI